MAGQTKMWVCTTVGIVAILIVLSFPLSAIEKLSIRSVLPDSAVTTPGAKVKLTGTGFLPDAVVYFDGIQARQTNFVSPAELDVETPYLRPGTHLIQIAVTNVTVRSDIGFTALASDVDSVIDRAIETARQGKTDEALSALEGVGTTDNDYQVRAAAYYQESEIALNKGDLYNWHRASMLIYLDAAKSGGAVQTYWRYRLAMAQSLHYLDEQMTLKFDLKFADQLVDFDVTQDPEPRFYRALLNARSGNLAKAKVDSDFVLSVLPKSSSAQALAAFVAALGGDTQLLRAMTSGPMPIDPTSLELLGEGLFLTGDSTKANKFWAQAGADNPAGATMAFLAAQKHVTSGETAMAKTLFAQAAAMAPNSKEGLKARDALSHLEH